MQSPCRYRQARRLASIVAIITLSSGCSISGFVSDDDAAERVDASTTTVQASTQVFTDMGSDFRGIIDDVNLKECPTAKGDRQEHLRRGRRHPDRGDLAAGRHGRLGGHRRVHRQRRRGRCIDSMVGDQGPPRGGGEVCPSGQIQCGGNHWLIRVITVSSQQAKVGLATGIP